MALNVSDHKPVPLGRSCGGPAEIADNFLPIDADRQRPPDLIEFEVNEVPLVVTDNKVEFDSDAHVNCLVRSA